MYKIGAIAFVLVAMIISQDTVTERSFFCLGVALVFAVISTGDRK